jgi:HlyD family secretion protein
VDGIVNEAFVKPYADEVVYQKARLVGLQAAQAAEAPVFAEQKRQIDGSTADLRRNLTEIQQGVAALTLTAPTAGQLTGFDLQPGQAIKPGDTLGEVSAGGVYKLRGQVDEFYAERLAAGLPAAVIKDERTLSVKVTRVLPKVVDGRIAVEFAFDGPAPTGLKPGESLDVKLSLGESREALVAPGGAWLQEGGGRSVFVLDQGGDRADRRTVSTGRHNADSVEILGGLGAGDRVITAARQDLSHIDHLRLKQGRSHD